MSRVQSPEAQGQLSQPSHVSSQYWGRVVDLKRLTVQWREVRSFVPTTRHYSHP